jgi:hypothetical protein
VAAHVGHGGGMSQFRRMIFGVVMRRFDVQALYRALDEQRAARGQSWRDVAEAIGVSVATSRRLRSGGRMEVDGMLAMVAWLGVPVETFVRESAQ